MIHTYSAYHDNNPLIPNIPYELLSLIIDYSTYSLNKEMKKIKDEETMTTLKKKFGKTTLDMFITDENIFINNKLNNREIYLLAKLFIINIEKIKTIKIYYISKNILFSINFLKEGLFNLSKELCLSSEKELKKINDDTLDFQLKFIFICNEFIKINKNIILELRKIDFKIFINSFNTIIHSLKLNIKLVTLYLSANYIGIDGAIEIASALKINTTLTTLILLYNRISNDGTRALAEALIKNTTLATFSINNNNIGAKGTNAIAEALKINTALTTLYIYDNDIGDEGATALAEALITNTTLTTLSINNNNIGAKGTNAIAEALKKNTALTILYMYGNNIGDTGATALAEALETNTTLLTLFIVQPNNNTFNKDIFTPYSSRVPII